MYLAVYLAKKVHFLQLEIRICHHSQQSVWQKTYRIWLVEGPNLVSMVVDFLQEDLLPFSVEFMEI